MFGEERILKNMERHSKTIPLYFEDEYVRDFCDCGENINTIFSKKVSHSRYIRGEVTRATGRKITGRGVNTEEEGGGETIASGKAAQGSDDCGWGNFQDTARIVVHSL